MLRTLLARGLIALAGVATPVSSAPAFTATSTIVSDYVFRGLRVAGASVQPGIELNAGSYVAGIGMNVPLEKAAPAQPKGELDLYGSHRFAVTSQTQATIGFAAYFFRDASPVAGLRSQLVEPHLGVSYTVAGVQFSSTCFYDLRREGPAVEFGAATALPLTRLGTELDLAATGGSYRLRDVSSARDSRIKASGSYWSIEASIPLQLPVGKLTAGLGYSASEDAYITAYATPRRTNPLATHRFVGRFGYSYSF